jgi:hypothetical protein
MLLSLQFVCARVFFLFLFLYLLNDCGLEFLNCSCLVEKIWFSISLDAVKDWVKRLQILRFYLLFVLFYGCLKILR